MPFFVTDANGALKVTGPTTVITGINGVQGNQGPPAMEFPDYDFIEPMMYQGPVGPAGAAGATGGAEDFVWFMGS